MDNFDFKKYLAEGRIHESEDTVSEKKQGYNDKLDDSEGAKHGKKKQDMKQRRADAENMEKAKGKRKFSGDKSMDEVEEGYGKKYEEDDKDAMSEEMKDEDKVSEEMSPSKMKKSELKAKIKETILAELGGFQADQAGSQYHAGLYNEAEEDVDVDVDFEDEVNIDAEGDDIEIERPAVSAKVNVGLSPEEEIIQDSLKAAMDAADALGNEKLGDQIGNTITFFTREYVVGRNND